MFLSKFFTPKWQHKNPNIRKRALLSLGNKVPDRQVIYTAVAKNDEEASIRRIAVQRLLDLNLLARIANDDKDQNVRSDASQRSAYILSGKLKSGPGLDERNEKIKSITDESILNYLLKNAVDSSIRLSIAERFDQLSIYADVATTDSDIDVQLTALAHISQKAILERIVKQTRRKNKAVSQAAQARLHNIHQQEETAQKLRQEAKLLCAEVNGLISNAREKQSWTDAQNALERIHLKWDGLRSDWTSLSGDVGDGLQAKFDKVCRAFIDEQKDFEEGQAKRHAQNEKYMPIQQEKRAMCDMFESDLNDLHKVKALSRADIEKLENILSRNKSDWQMLSSKTNEPLEPYDGALDKALNDQHGQLMDKARDYQSDIELYLKSIEIAKKLAKQAAQLVKKSGNIRKPDIVKLQDKWISLNKPRYFRLADIGSIDIDAQISELFSAYEHQEISRKHDRREFLKVVKSLEGSVRQGKAVQANKLAKQASNLLRKLSVDDVKGFREDGSLQKFQTLQQQVDEFQDWRKWSNEPKKIQLCQTMKNLLVELEQMPEGAEVNYEDVAEQVRLARNEWKSLSKAEVNASVELWERFDSACKQVYEPCQEYFGTEAAKRDENLAQKETLCNSLDKYIHMVVNQANEDIDWQAVDKIIRVAAKDWRKLGPVNRKDKKAIDERFRLAVNKLGDLNREQKQLNSDKKIQVIKRAEKIAAELVDEQASLGDAIASIKKLQANWKTIGPGIKDAALWRGFRKPCDAVFGLRTSKIEQEKQAQDSLISKRTEMCEKLESLTCLSPEDLIRQKTDIDALAQQWAELGSLSKRDALALRYSNAVQALNKQMDAARLAQHGALKQQQKTQVSMCIQAENLLRNLLESDKDITQFELEFEKISQPWEGLEQKQDSLSKSIIDRFQTAVQLFENIKVGDKNVIRAGLEKISITTHKTKQTLCLQLEIAANVESPSEYKQDRMAYQVSVLANKMKHDGATDMASEAEDLVLRWHKAGFVTHSDANDLENRFFNTYNNI